MRTERFFVDDGEGWDLDVKRYWDPFTLRSERRPIVMIPGYAMNTFILAFHPSGPSMVEYLVRDGFEVWTANLRGQGDSRRRSGSRRFGLPELVMTDLPRVLAFVRDHRRDASARIDAVGCSLGASMLYAWLAHHPDDHGLGALIAIGGPLRWSRRHPALALAFSCPPLLGAIRIRGTRRIARTALPILRRVPALLSVYLHPDMIDMDAAPDLARSVDDPVPRINAQIARWMRDGDLLIGGLDVTTGLARVRDLRVLCILGNADGIVPPEAALSVVDVLGRDRVDVLRVGDDSLRFAHADLFIARTAQDRVFEPLRQWLAAGYR